MHGKKLGRLLALVSRAHYNLASRTFPQLGLQRGQVSVLLELVEEDGITQSDLADSLEVTPATLTNLLNRMEDAGFIVRRRDQTDTRISRVYLSEKGKSVLSQASRLVDEVDSKAFAGFSAEESEKLNYFLQRIHDNLMK